MVVEMLPGSLSSKINESPTGCWLWAAGKNDAGYGYAWFNRKTQRAHRVVYELLVGPIPSGLHLDHLCRTRHCVNPDHLEPVTPGENTRRGRSHNREKTHCPQGHEYTKANTYNCSKGRRCRACDRDAWHTRRHNETTR